MYVFFFNKEVSVRYFPKQYQRGVQGFLLIHSVASEYGCPCHKGVMAAVDLLGRLKTMNHAKLGLIMRWSCLIICPTGRELQDTFDRISHCRNDLYANQKHSLMF